VQTYTIIPPTATPPTVTASIPGGTYGATQTVSLTTTPGATIYYSLDGSDPRASSTRITYTDSILISSTTTLRYGAVDSEGNGSPLYLQNYIIGAGGLANTPSQGDGNVNGQSKYTGPQTSTIKWTYLLDNGIYSSPAIGTDGTIYIGTWEQALGDGDLYALNPDGTLKWKYDTNGGIKGTPVIGTDGTIYVGSYNGLFYALNPDGSVKWTYNAGFEHYITNSAAISDDGTIYVSADNAGLYALNPDGTVKWTFPLRGGFILGPHGTIYSAHFAINPDGTLKWYYNAGVISAIGPNGTIYAQDGSGARYLYALNSDGTEKWTYIAEGDIWTGVTIESDGTIHFGTKNSSYDGIVTAAFYSLNPDGTLKWKYNAQPGGTTIGADGTIYYGGDNLYAFNSDGTVKWTYQVPSKVVGSSTIVADGTLYFGSDIGIVYAFRDLVPVANFTAAPVSGVTPLTVQFTDLSTAVPTSWSWDFGDGGTSSDQNPVHIYTNPGNYNVSLNVNNMEGADTIIKNNYITVADITPPTVSNSLGGGTYGTAQTAVLTSDDPTATIYYTSDTTDPRTSATRVQYIEPITISSTTTLRYAAVDPSDNWSQLYLANYVIGVGGLAETPKAAFQGDN